MVTFSLFYALCSLLSAHSKQDVMVMVVVVVVVVVVAVVVTFI
jgi:hypothetical protein